MPRCVGSHDRVSNNVVASDDKVIPSVKELFFRSNVNDLDFRDFSSLVFFPHSQHGITCSDVGARRVVSKYSDEVRFFEPLFQQSPLTMDKRLGRIVLVAHGE